MFKAGLVVLLQFQQFVLQRGRRDAQVEQRLPVRRQFAQCRAQFLQLAVGSDQLAQGAVVTQLTVLHRLIQALAQRRLALQQLLRVSGAYQKELAGGLLPGQLGDTLGLGQQFRLLAEPLAQIILCMQLPQPSGTKQQ